MYYVIQENRLLEASDNIKNIHYDNVKEYQGLSMFEYAETKDNYTILDDLLIRKTDVEILEQAQRKEAERISKLSLTKREVFLALYESKGLTPQMVRSQITDTKALIEFDYATEYFRGNPLIDTIGIMLGYTSQDLDYLFKNKEFPKNE
ncbi:hypothetical protein IJD44_02530 [bacterium]|nr:hypothetical protein [bacterium]